MRDRCCYAKSNYFSFLLVPYLLFWGIAAGCLVQPSFAFVAFSTFAQADRATVETPPISTSAFKVGDRGADVRILQEQLKELGYFEGEVDGDYGGKTQAAVGKFQEQEGIDADGIAGTSTLERLAAKLAEQKAETAEQETETGKEKTPAKGRSRRKFLLFVFGGSFLTFGIVGSGLFLLLRAFNRAMQPPDPLEDPLMSEEGEDNLLAAKNKKASKAIAPPPDALPEAAETAPSPPEGKFINKTDFVKEEVREATESDELSNLWEEDPPPIEDEGETPPETSGDRESSPVSPPREIQESSPQSESLSLRKTTRLPRVDRVEALIEDLQEQQPEKRRKAIWELAQRADSRAVQPLIGLLIDSDSQQRGLILEALSQIGTRTLKPMNRALTIALQDENAQVRKNAIRDLTQMYELMGKLSKLLYLAMDDPDPEVQDTAKWALKQLNSVQINLGDRPDSDA